MSIKPSQQAAWTTQFTEDGFEADSAPVEYLLRVAFAPKIALVDILREPKWAWDDHYTIHAKVAPEDVQAYQALSREQRGQMLQALLADRFHLRFHYGTTEHSAYNMTLLGTGSKLKSLKEGKDYSGSGYMDPVMPVDGMLRFHAHPSSMAQLARRLSWMPDVEVKEVMDRTGLTGFYTFDLTWCPIREEPDPGPAMCSGPSLFSALREQLGLELKPMKGSFPTVIIDDIERPSPS
ncbi:MAG: TIGR03435 family protein [Terracidiphilus sp.]